MRNLRKMRLIRCRQGKTLDYIADAMFLTAAYLRRFENGELDLKIAYKQKIAKLLDVTVKELSQRMSMEEIEKYFHSNGAFKGFKNNKEIVEKERKVKIIKACKNQACLLNKECFCISDAVKEGRGSCAGQNLVKDKPVNLSRNALY